MTIPQQPTPAVDPYSVDTVYSAPVVRPGRGLAGAIAVFLGGYLLLASFSSVLNTVSMILFAGFADRGSPMLPGGTIAMLVLQFLFAIIVVIAGLLIAGGSVAGKLVGALLVVVGSLLTFTSIGLRLNGLLPLPGGRDGIPFQAVFANSWFAVVLVVGIAWLLTRRARLGWLSILGTLVLIPVPIALAFANVESGVQQIILFLLAGIVGAGIILAGRPLRD
jgi:hypothetical protein